MEYYFQTYDGKCYMYSTSKTQVRYMSHIWFLRVCAVLLKWAHVHSFFVPAHCVYPTLFAQCTFGFSFTLSSDKISVSSDTNRHVPRFPNCSIKWYFLNIDSNFSARVVYDGQCTAQFPNSAGTLPEAYCIQNPFATDPNLFGSFGNGNSCFSASSPRVGQYGDRLTRSHWSTYPTFGKPADDHFAAAAPSFSFTSWAPACPWGRLINDSCFFGPNPPSGREAACDLWTPVSKRACARRTWHVTCCFGAIRSEENKIIHHCFQDRHGTCVF